MSTGWLDLPRELREYVYFLRHKALFREVLEDIPINMKKVPHWYKTHHYMNYCWVVRRFDIDKNLISAFLYPCMMCGRLLPAINYDYLEARHRETHSRGFDLPGRPYGLTSYICGVCDREFSILGIAVQTKYIT